MSQALIQKVEDILKQDGIEITPDNRALFEDDVLDLLEEAKDYTKNDFTAFENEEGVIEYPFGVARFIGGAILFYEQSHMKHGLKSRSMGSVSYTFKEDIPSSVYGRLNRFRKKAGFHVFKH